MQAQYLKHLDDLRARQPYQNYLRVRGNVFKCLEMMDARAGAPSSYWKEELAGFDYLLDASPLIIEKLREHCYHITGIKSYEYRLHHAHAAEPFRKKLALLKALDSDGLFVGENASLGGFGHDIDGQLVNIDTLKFYESLIAMQKAGLLTPAKGQRGERQVWLEIGAGWGGFAYQVKTLFPNVTYVIVDLPQTLLFSATYLMSVFPQARCAFYPEASLEEVQSSTKSYDFIFLPHFMFQRLNLRVNLAINMVSFQEMTTEQVVGYVKNLKNMGCEQLYSHNRDRSGHNPELTTVTSIIEDHFGSPREIEVLGYGYTSLTPPAARARRAEDVVENAGWPRWLRSKKKVAPQPVKKHAPRKAGHYRHLVVS
jgi:putative sugar O-methyltransferase